MPKYDYNDILMPLALTVIIDSKVRDPELFEFKRQSAALFNLFGLSPMTKQSLDKWFTNHEKDIRSLVEGPKKNTAILRALTRIKEPAHMEAMYDAMVTISVCDKEYNTEESKLIKSAASIWGFQRPPIKVDR